MMVYKYVYGDLVSHSIKLPLYIQKRGCANSDRLKRNILCDT